VLAVAALTAERSEEVGRTSAVILASKGGEEPVEG
jgi:hypothetical protein